MNDEQATHVVLGAGCAGLSLTVALLRAGVRDPIVLVDRRTTHGRDRTWCFWDVESNPFTPHASYRWPAWTVQTEAGGVTRGSRRHPYVHLDSRDFYAAALGELAGHDNVDVRLGESVLDVRDDGAGATVRTTAGTILAEHVFDGRGRAGGTARPGEIELSQHFLGWVARTDRPVFDPGRCTLMDFRVDQARGLHFLYVLPFAPNRALVEDTYVSAGTVPAAMRRADIECYLGDRLAAGEWFVEHEEHGRIPMTTRRFALAPSPHVHPIGLAAGAARASSGYAFVRIQRHCARLARAVADAAPLPERLAPARYDALDRIFLRALARDPGAFPEHFRRMVAGTPPPAFARFMCDASGLGDEARLIASLPKAPFLRAALASRPRVAARRPHAAATPRTHDFRSDH